MSDMDSPDRTAVGELVAVLGVVLFVAVLMVMHARHVDRHVPLCTINQTTQTTQPGC